jgi:hypothetical protein
MEPQRVGPIGGTGSEHPGERSGSVVARVDSQEIPPGLVKPGDDDDLLPGSQALEPLDVLLVDIDPGIGSTLGALLGCVCGGPQG